MNNELFDLSGRVSIVTGGNGGLGRSIALGLARAGAAVAVFGRNSSKNSQVLLELIATGVPCMAVTVDLTKREDLAPAFRRVETELGGVDILVNNAGNVSLSGGVLPRFFSRRLRQRVCLIEREEKSSTLAVCILSSALAWHQHTVQPRARFSSLQSPWLSSSHRVMFK